MTAHQIRGAVPMAAALPWCDSRDRRQRMVNMEAGFVQLARRTAQPSSESVPVSAKDVR
jgi:hypothetical protein